MRWFDSLGRLYCTICSLIAINSVVIYADFKYILYCKKELLLKSEEIMMQQVGKVETPQNKGIAKVYLASVGLSEGYAYCAAGQYFCFSRACNLLNISDKDIPIPKTGLSRKILSYAIQRGKKADYYPSRHDLIIWRVIGNSWRGHIERIISVEKAGWVRTVGFNVKMKNDKEGVAIKRRNLYHIIGRLKVAGLIGFGGV